MNSSNFSVSIPSYLTSDPEELKRELECFSLGNNTGHYFGSPELDEGQENVLFQGDGVTNVQVYDYASKELKRIKALIISNTCDISEGNSRHLPPHVTVVPLIDLDNYAKLLIGSGISEKAVGDKLQDFRLQKITNMYYLPRGKDGKEYVAALEKTQSLPLKDFVSQYEHMFSLSMYGFYLLLFKISVHFCRFHEKLNRPAIR